MMKKPISVVLLLLLLGTLACNLSRGGDSDNDDGNDADATLNAGVGNENSTPPTAQISSPVNDQQVLVNSPVDVRVSAQHEVGIKRLQMKVDDKIVSSKSLIDEPTSIEVLLQWTPTQTGTYTLEVQAFRGSVGSTPATVTLQVFAEGTILSNPASGQPATPANPNATNCTARVLIADLNARSGPGRSFGSEGHFDLGETLQVIGTNADKTWYKVTRTNNEQVWVIKDSDWITEQGDCSTLPTAS